MRAEIPMRPGAAIVADGSYGTVLAVKCYGADIGIRVQFPASSRWGRIESGSYGMIETPETVELHYVSDEGLAAPSPHACPYCGHDRFQENQTRFCWQPFTVSPGHVEWDSFDYGDDVGHIDYECSGCGETVEVDEETGVVSKP